jgi:PEGA domain
MNTAPGSLLPETSQPQDAAAPRPYTPGLSDGLGDRLMMFDEPTQSSVELLRFKREFAEAPGFEEELRARVDDMKKFRHPAVALVRGVQVLGGGEGLALVSNNTPGRRLSEMVQVAKGAPFAVDLIQQLAPALSALHQLGPHYAHGTLSAERIVITREGKLVVVEHVLGSAFEMLRLPATRLRLELGIAVPAGPGPFGLNQRCDVVQLGFIALSLVLGRQLDPAHYPANIGTLLDEFSALDAAASARLRPWLERSLQVGDRPFASAQEADAGFSERPPVRQAPAAVAPVSVPGPVEEEKTRAVLAFKPQGESPAPVVTQGMGPDRVQDEEEARPIRLQPLPQDPPQATKKHAAAAPVTPVASPRPAKSSLGWWIGGAIVAAATIGVGLVASGVVSPRTPAELPVTANETEATRPSTSATAAETNSEPPSPTVSAAPPVNTAPPITASTPPITPADAVSQVPPSAGLSTGAVPPAALTPLPKPVEPSAALAGGALKPEGATDRPAGSTGAFGGVKVTAPIELQVFENGALIGSTAGPIAMVDGVHVLEMVNDSLAFRVRSTVTVRAGQMAPVLISVPNGRVSINAAPWADVFIDGRPVGQTPLANIAVPIGAHEFVFRHPQLGEQKQTVLVKADGLTRVSATFQQ